MGSYGNGMTLEASVRVYAWRDQPPLPSTPPPGPVDLATWRLLWRVYAIRPNRVRMMARHLGLTGGDPVSLRELGREHRLSSARMAAIKDRVVRAAMSVGPPVSLRSLVERLPVVGLRFADDLIADLIADELLAEPLSLQAIRAIAELYGLNARIPEALAVIDGRQLVASPEMAVAIRLWRSRIAVASLIAPVTLANLPPPQGVPARLTRPLLESDARLACSEDTKVVWRVDRLCSAGDIVLRMLTNGPQRLSTLQRAVTRRYAGRYTGGEFRPPSVEALGVYLASQSWVAVSGEVASLVAPAPPLLTGAERVFLDGVAGASDDS